MLAVLKNRIDQIFNLLPEDALVIIRGGTHVYRNLDVDYPFRQDSDFAYLTDWYQPDAWLALRKATDQVEAVLVCPDKDPTIERWEGLRAMPATIMAAGHAEYVITYSEFVDKLPLWLKQARQLFIPFAQKESILDLLYNVTQQRTYPRNIKALHNISHILGLQRLIKTPDEIERLRQAAQISAQAHIALMRAAPKLQYEYQLSALFRQYCYHLGCQHLAYESIVASGDNTCILHYRTCRDELDRNGLILVDAGGEWQGYASDITRTFPANGRFSQAQRRLYEIVLAVQMHIIAMIKPGVSFKSLQQAAVTALEQQLDAIGIFKDTQWTIKDVFFHGISHWLGRDVHDPCPYVYDDGHVMTLQPGMVLTIEPGLYFARHLDGIETSYLGIGIRIEDDILVTESGCEVLSAACPKTIDEIEDIMSA